MYAVRSNETIRIYDSFAYRGRATANHGNGTDADGGKRGGVLFVGLLLCEL